MKKITNILNRKEKIKLSQLSAFSLINSIAESLSIAMIFPILTFIFNRQKFDEGIIFFKFINSFLDKFQNDITTPLILLIIIYLIKTAFQIFFVWFQTKTILDIELNICRRVFNAFLSQDYQESIKKNSSIIMEILSREVKNFASCLLQITNLLLETTLILILICIMFLSFGTIFLKILLILMASVVLIYLLIGRKFKIWGLKRHEFATKALKTMIHGINSFKEIKLYKKENFFNKEYIKNLKVGLNYIKIMTFFSSIPKVMYEILFISIISIYIYIYSQNSFSLEASLPSLAFAGAAMVRILPGLSRITVAISQINSSSVSISKIHELVINRKNNYVFNEKKIEEDESDREILKGNIEIKNLNFKYESQKKNIIENLNLSIEKGEYLGLKGHTGSGKTTLINLICGLINVQSGEILIEGIDISKIKNNWQKVIGYVPQKIYLIDDTIKNNIIFGNEEKNIDTKKLDDILQISQCSDFINKLPEGINTYVGENGVYLSGGQIQRIGIARALFAKPKFLILDESTNALDINTENKLLSNLSEVCSKGHITILSVSHKENALQHCKKIYELKDKKLNIQKN
tara:strand:+ start:6325 stop:8061 length:1737 start_codon:yes stop_codon:yes gene_type:complete